MTAHWGYQPSKKYLLSSTFVGWLTSIRNSQACDRLSYCGMGLNRLHENPGIIPMPQAFEMICTKDQASKGRIHPTQKPQWRPQSKRTEPKATPKPKLHPRRGWRQTFGKQRGKGKGGAPKAIAPKVNQRLGENLPLRNFTPKGNMYSEKLVFKSCFTRSCSCGSPDHSQGIKRIARASTRLQKQVLQWSQLWGIGTGNGAY